MVKVTDLGRTRGAHASNDQGESASQVEGTDLRPNKLVTYKVVAMIMASAQRLGVTKIGIVGNEQFL